MIEHDFMIEKYHVLLNKEKRLILSKLGTPTILCPSFAVYNKNNLWMVLFFKDEQVEKEFHSRMQAISFFDDKMRLLWSKGIQLMPKVTEEEILKYTTVDEVVAAYGKPYAEIGSSKSAIQYFTEDGHIIFVKYEEDRIIGVTRLSLPGLAEKYKLTV